MDTTPTVLTYAPLIAAAAIGLGILVVAKGNEELRHEIHNTTERIVETLVHHRHTDSDGGVIFTRPVN